MLVVIAIRLEPHDEYMHELGPEPNFNESMYFNVYDPKSRSGGFFRLGNRANEGSGEMTVCVWLPDGRIGFMFRRPKITTNDAFDAAGMRFEVIEPFEKLRVSYSGTVALLDEPLQMADPKAAFTNNPHVACELDLTYTRLSSMFGGEPDTPSERPGEEFARAHYEQLVHAKGTLVVGEESFDVSGQGMRDHSWGPRYWQAPWYYRWLTANFDSDFGFMGSRVARRDGPGIRGGFIWEGDQLHVCDDFQITSTWDDDGYHRSLEAVLKCNGRALKIKGKVFNLVPLRNRRLDPSGNELLTRIAEGLTEWTIDDGRVGYGLSEYLDQIVDGAPVGLSE